MEWTTIAVAFINATMTAVGVIGSAAAVAWKIKPASRQDDTALNPTQTNAQNSGSRQKRSRTPLLKAALLLIVWHFINGYLLWSQAQSVEPITRTVVMSLCLFVLVTVVQAVVLMTVLTVYYLEGRDAREYTNERMNE